MRRWRLSKAADTKNPAGIGHAGTGAGTTVGAVFHRATEAMRPVPIRF